MLKLGLNMVRVDEHCVNPSHEWIFIADRKYVINYEFVWLI